MADFFPEARGLVSLLKIILSDITLEILHYTSNFLKNSTGISTPSLDAGGEYLPRTKTTGLLLNLLHLIEFLSLSGLRQK